MRGMLSSVITRPIQRLTILSAIGMLVATTAFASNRSGQPKLDEADLALEKARILLGATVCTSPERDAEACDKVLRKAMERLDRARSTIVEAAGEVTLPQK